jgi:hypothetical protein
MLTGTAVVDLATPPISVTPGQELVVVGKLDLTLHLAVDPEN